MFMVDEQSGWEEWSSEKWAEWIEERVKIRKNTYTQEPSQLIASHNRERSHVRDYHGRELLELIQNADDAGLHYSGECRLTIILKESGLFVANTGIPFSPQGIESLMISDLSPKQRRGEKYIGYKGLGFRSLLGWASCIAIISGKARIGFSHAYAQSWLERFIQENPHIGTRISEWTAQNGRSAPIATLDLPIPLLNSHLDEEVFNRILEAGEAIKNEGFDTVVCIGISNPTKVIPEIREQLAVIDSETLIFMQNVTNLELRDGEILKSWKIERDNDVVLVREAGKEAELWNIFNDSGELPDTLLEKHDSQSKRYEIKIAIPDQPQKTSKKLYVYFPTEVRLDFPVVVHATFEITSNRQNLIKSDINRYISEKMAGLMARAAVKIRKPDNPWFAVESFMISGNIDPILEGFQFPEKLLEELKQVEIFPVRNGEFMTAQDAKSVRGNMDSLLFGDGFHNVCLFHDKEGIYKQYGIEELPYSDLREQINQCANQFTLEQRAALIYILCTEYTGQNTPPILLLDSASRPIPLDATPLIGEEREFELPQWVPKKFIHPELMSLLKKQFDVPRNRSLIPPLKLFKVQEYNLQSVISSLNAETNKRIKANPENALSLRIEMIQALWRIFQSNQANESISERFNIELPSRDGESYSSDKLYFGEEYDKGQLLEYLYQRVDESLFVASPEKLGFEKTSQSIENFLSWLGVAEKPRLIRKTIYNNEYKLFVLANLKNPAQFDDHYLDNPLENEWRIQDGIQYVSTIDQLEKILELADHHAIMCWVIQESRLEEWKQTGDNIAKLWYNPGSRYYDRQLTSQALPSYPYWLLRNTPWMVTSNGEKREPASCSWAKIAKDLSPVIGFPAFDLEHPLFKSHNIDRQLLIQGFARAGVVPDLDDLPWDSFYEILLKLPEMDPGGEKARSVYRALVARGDTDSDRPDGEMHRQFMDKGMMFGKKLEEAGYYPIDDLYYVDNNTLPDHIARLFPLVDLDKKRGSQKVQSLFGVQTLTEKSIKLEVENTVEHSLNTEFRKEYDRLLPYIYALRANEDSAGTDLRALKRLEIRLCSAVTISVAVNEENHILGLEPGKSITKENTAYLVAEHNKNQGFILRNELIANAIGEVITSLFRVDISSDIARLASCSKDRREQLLNLIAGGNGEERLRIACEKLEVDDEDDFVIDPPPQYEPPPQQSKNAESNEDAEETAEDLTEEPIIPEDEINVVEATEKGYTPDVPKTVSTRISSNAKPATATRPKHLVNPDRSENLAVRFEEQQGRYPLKVSHIRGSNSYGCDILSFRSEEDQQKFIENLDLPLIERFIEVKGRSQPKGSITLKGNELSFAQQHQQRYYLYRVYEIRMGEFELVELADPSADNCRQIQYEINPFQSSNAKRWAVVEIKGAEE